MWRRRFPREPGDSLENLSVLRCMTLGHTIRLRQLTIDLQQPGPGHGWRPEPAARRAAKQTQGIRGYVATGRQKYTEVGAGLDIRIDARAARGDGDAHGRGVESVAATVARSCTGREPMSMTSAAAATVTAEPVSGGATRGRDTHSIVAVGSGADVSDIPEVVSDGVVWPCRDGMPGTCPRCRRGRGAG